MSTPAPLVRDGIPASTVHLPAGPWTTVLDALCARFPAIARERWHDRMARGAVLDRDGRAIAPDRAYAAGLCVRYFRDVPNEAPIPFREAVLHADAHVVVADKPHFLPVMPGGMHVRETLLTRLIRRLDNPHLVPLHRIDRLTAGLVLLSANPETRARYQALFRERRIAKRYEAWASPLADRNAALPFVRRSRIVASERRFRMCEGPGAPNAETIVDVIERGESRWHYALTPVTGRTHQLRVHMAALGAGIENDPLYPTLYPRLASRGADDYARPLQLLARSLAFDDPLDGRPRRFDSALQLHASPQFP